MMLRALLLPVAAASALIACAEVAAPPPPVQTAGSDIAEGEETSPAGWVFPITGGAMPTDPKLLPNAEREYRSGSHEGIDIYYLKNGDGVPCNMPVLNTRTGWITRADHSWPPMTAKEYDAIIGLLNRGVDEGREAAMDRLRGVQVWLRTEDGMLVRYCHLNAVAPHVQLGAKIAPGVVVGYVGNSGTVSSVKGPWRNCHLHFEIWPTEGTYLGKGLSPPEAGALYMELFRGPLTSK